MLTHICHVFVKFLDPDQSSDFTLNYCCISKCVNGIDDKARTICLLKVKVKGFTPTQEMITGTHASLNRILMKEKHWESWGFWSSLMHKPCAHAHRQAPTPTHTHTYTHRHAHVHITHKIPTHVTHEIHRHT